MQIPSPLVDMLATYPPHPFGVSQGILVALVFFLGVLLIHVLPKYKWTAAAVLLALITPLALAGFWFSTDQRGISDWDYYFSLHTTHRSTLLEYQQLPHWNPYICGGTAGIADPEFRFFTPTFLLQLAFGIPAGFRLAIFLATAAGAIGMLLLSKQLRLSVYAGLVASLIFAFSSVNLLEVVEGHPNIFAAMYLPWIFWAWLAAYRKSQKPGLEWLLGSWSLSGHWPVVIGYFNHWHLITGTFLALAFFQGGIYLLMYTALAFIAFPFLAAHPKTAIITTLKSGLWALGLAAVKLIPVFLWLTQFQDEMYASSTYLLPHLDKILFGRILHNHEELLPNQGSSWHEYGAYIGPVAGILAAMAIILIVIGTVKRFRNSLPAAASHPIFSRLRLSQALLVGTTIAIYIASLGPILKPFFDETPFIPRSNISRLIILAIIALALLAGQGLDWLRSRGKHVRAASLIIIGALALDLFTLAYPLSEQSFVLPPVVPAPPPAPQPIAYTAFDYKIRHQGSDHTQGSDYTRAYDALLQGYGTMTYCSVLTPPRAVKTIHDEGPVEIIDFNKNRGSFKLISWTPNEVKIEATVPEGSELILNTNYARGWQVNGQPADEVANRVADKNPPAGTHLYTFRYYTPGFLLGSSISITTLFLATYLLIRRKRADTPNRPPG